MRKPIALSSFLPLLALCLVAATLQAQTDTRADVLSGRVTDLTGKPVPDALVGATPVGSGRTRSYTTDAEGRYKIFFPEAAAQYRLEVKRMGFAPVQRTITRRTNDSEQMTIDVQLGGTPLALSMVEINGCCGGGGGDDGVPFRETEKSAAIDATVPNPVAEFIAMSHTMPLSAVEMIGLTDLADTLQAKNSRIYRNIRTLLAKSQEAGDMTQMAGSVAMMLEEASANTAKAVGAAQKLLRPEQWQILPPVIRDGAGISNTGTAKQ